MGELTFHRGSEGDGMLLADRWSWTWGNCL